MLGAFAWITGVEVAEAAGVCSCPPQPARAAAKRRITNIFIAAR